MAHDMGRSNLKGIWSHKKAASLEKIQTIYDAQGGQCVKYIRLREMESTTLAW